VPGVFLAKSNMGSKDLVSEAVALIDGAFPGLGAEKAKALLAEAPMSTYPPGTELCREGARESIFYIVVEGEVDIVKQLSEDAERFLARVRKGSFFGEMALIEDKRRAATARTVCATTVVEVSKDAFDSLLHSNPAVALALMKVLTSHLRQADRSAIAELSRKNVELQQALADLKIAQDELVERERMARDLEIARQFQQRLLPDPAPNLAGWSLAGRYRPARMVGGDLFDVLVLNDSNSVGLVVADVSDKGVEAALAMAMLKVLFQAESRLERSPSRILKRVHEEFMGSLGDSSFVTAFCGILDLVTGDMCYSRAGHDYPIIVRRGGAEVEVLASEGRFLGMVDNFYAEEGGVTLHPGDSLVIYSDGVTDAINHDDEMYGLQRFTELLRGSHDLGATPMRDAVLAGIDEFRADAQAQDDITLLIIKRDLIPTET